MTGTALLQRRWRGTAMIHAVVMLLTLAGCVAAPTVGTGAFHNPAAIASELRRGKSTRSDVQKLLGVPSGNGAAAFRNVADGPREIWYYEDIEATDTRPANDTITMTLRQQILLIFFKGDMFDGYLWTTNSAPAALR